MKSKFFTYEFKRSINWTPFHICFHKLYFSIIQSLIFLLFTFFSILTIFTVTYCIFTTQFIYLPFYSISMKNLMRKTIHFHNNNKRNANEIGIKEKWEKNKQIV